MSAETHKSVRNSQLCVCVCMYVCVCDGMWVGVMMVVWVWFIFPGQSGGSSGGGASGRRDYYPPHIQQLLDQDRHTYSYDHRSSPLRRPVYRKVMVGGGVPPSAYDGNPLPVNLQGELVSLR